MVKKCVYFVLEYKITSILSLQLQKADTNKSMGGGSTLDSEEFVHFYHSVTERAEVEEIFLK